MEYKDVLKKLEKAIEEDNALFGEFREVTYQSYSTYALAVNFTEAFYKLTNLMTTDEATEKRLQDELLEIAKLCIVYSTMLDTTEEEKEEEEEEDAPRTIGFAVADKERPKKTKRDKEKEEYLYPVETYAVGYETYDECDENDESDDYDEEGDW